MTRMSVADGKWVSIGSIEPQFYALLLEKAELTDPAFQAQMDRSKVAGTESQDDRGNEDQDSR